MTLLRRIFFLIPIFTKLIKLMTKKQKFQLLVLVIFTIGLSLIETIGISAIMPFVSIVDDTSILESGYYKIVFDFLGFDNPETFIIAFGIAIIMFYFFRGGYSFLHIYLIKRYSNSIYKFYSKKAFKINLSLPYKVFTLRNTAELMQSINSETRAIGGVTLHILKIFTELFTIIMIYSVILLINWRMTLIITAILLSLIVIMLSFLTVITSSQGKKKLVSGRKMSRVVKEAFNNIKFIKLKGNADEVINNYSHSLDINTRTHLVNSIVSIIPKNILETLGFSFLIGVVVFVVWVYNDASMVIPVISMYALALFRILPSVHRLLKEVNSIVYSEATIEKVYENIRQPVENEGKEGVSFKNYIRLENIHFQYLTGKEIISDISLEIKKGEKIAFTGESGSGKSTLVDIITGIHKPISGTVSLDGIPLSNNNICCWRKKIGYIPQTIYLFDGTVAENVSFGSMHDEEKIKAALIKANIWDFLLQKDGINTRVGDGGIQLSGGQQQRICIARALYDDPEVLVLDEATSALDNETEEKIMEEIYHASTNKTLIVIAHRLTTVERCDRRIHIRNGKIV